MNAIDWLTELRRLNGAGDWEAVAALRKRTNEDLARGLESDALRSFYDTAALHGLTSARGELLRSARSPSFKASLRPVIDGIKQKLASRPELKGVYFEYYYDGHRDGSNTGNFFLCNSYSLTEDVWGSDFDQEGYVAGAELPDYFFFDAEWEWDDESRLIALEVVNGWLLADLIEEWKRSGIERIPLGFANHDHEMVRVAAP
jgi:hypothetical protein